jgi:hypothetical protein
MQDECQTSPFSPKTHRHVFSGGCGYLEQESTSLAGVEKSIGLKINPSRMNI